jgi:hypothetical protein
MSIDLNTRHSSGSEEEPDDLAIPLVIEVVALPDQENNSKIKSFDLKPRNNNLQLLSLMQKKSLSGPIVDLYNKIIIQTI